MVLRPGLVWLCTISVVLGTKAAAQGGGDHFPIGARSWGTANAVVAQSDRYSLFNNMAGLATQRETSLISSYHSYYGFEGVSTLAIGAVLPVGQDLTTGVSVQRFGDHLYNELSLGAGISHRINHVSLGVKFNYRQIGVSTPSLILSKKALVLDMGGIVQLSPSLYLGAHVYNLTQSSFSGSTNEKLPTILRTGLSYIPATSLTASAEVAKNTDYPASLRFGLEYKVLPAVSVRTGIATQPYTNHFGVGFERAAFSVDYAASTHPSLGWSHHFTLAYTWPKAKAESQL